MMTRIYFRDLPGYMEMTEHQKKYIGKNTYYNLEMIHEESLQKEVEKFVRHRATELSVKSFYKKRKVYKHICRFLNEKGDKSLKDRSGEFWMRSLKMWMIKEGIPLNYNEKGVYGNITLIRSPVLGYMERLIQFMIPQEIVSERQKDIWQLENLGIQIQENPVKTRKTVNFTKIYQSQLREEVKSGIYMNLQSESMSCIQRELTAMRRFSAYLKVKHPDIQSCKDLDRKIIEDYLIHLKTEEESNRYLHSELTRLRAILECIGKIYDYRQMELLILARDIPPAPKSEFKDYSDAELKRLNAGIVELDEQYARAMIIHQLLGTRISDTLTLQTDCLYEKNETYIIRIRQVKTKPYEKPVSEEIAMLIRSAIQYTRKRYGKTKYIFVSEKNTDRPLQYATIQYHVVKMIREKNLRDDQGVLFGFGSHLYRHTYGVKLTQMHLDDWTIAKLLGHSSVKNVKYYRKMRDDILADETRKARQKMSELILANLDGWEEEYEQIRQNACCE